MVVLDNMQTKYISEEYANELQQQLQEYTQEKQQLMDMLTYLKEQKSTGALIEDVGWQRAQDRLSYIEDQIDITSNCLLRAKIMEYPKNNTTVQLGSKVHISTKDSEIEYMIVESIEANPNKGKVSFISPLGRALIGRSANDDIEVSSPKKNAALKWKILSIA